MRLALSVVCLLLAGCATPSGNRGGAATIGKAILSPFNGIRDALTPSEHPSDQNAPKAKERAPASLPADGLTLTQPDNPAASSQQNLEIERTEELQFSKDSVRVGGGTAPRPTSPPAQSSS